LEEAHLTSKRATVKTLPSSGASRIARVHRRRRVDRLATTRAPRS
jgi:hypothetical protein